MKRCAFTLVELLITIMIIAIMAGMVIFALYAAQEQAREQKTRALVAKLDAIIKAKYESYRTRRVPVTIPPNAAPAVSAKMRLDGLRDLMRMEMPDRWTDVSDNPVAPLSGNPKIARPSVSENYLQKYNANKPSGEYQNAECLYLIVTASMGEDSDPREAISPSNVGDKDGDGWPEFHDAWGTPIRFLRWAPGYASEVQAIARLPVQAATANDLTVSGLKLSNEAGAYVGGVIVAVDRTTGQFQSDKMARISGYEKVGTDGKFTVNPSFTSTPSTSEDVAILAPDPFDPRGVSTSPSFGLVPLIYSAGPNRCYGIASDTGTHSYASNGLNPCFAPPSAAMIGTQQDLPSEPNFVKSGWLDNITNHRLSP